MDTPTSFVYVIAISLGITLLAGCSRTVWQINRTRERLEALELNMTKPEVIAAMGAPYKREAYLDEDGSPIEVLLYETEFTEAGPIPESAFTPILLRSGRVIGWGRNMYDQTTRHHIRIDLNTER